MAATVDKGHDSYPVFKGLQKPLEFLGIQGRYISWAAAAAGGGIVCFIIGYCLFGFAAGLTALAAVAGSGAAWITVRQRKGLHTKKSDKGIFVYAKSKKI